MLNYTTLPGSTLIIFRLYVLEMTFGQLPNDLVIQIGKELQRARDQSALMRTNGGIYSLLRPQLYQYNVDHQHCSGLVWAVQRQKISVALYFLQLPRVNVNARDEDGRTLLHTACIQNDGYYMIRILLRAGGIDLNATDQLGRTPLSYLASSGNLFSLDMLLQCRGVDVNVGNMNGQTPLHFAVQDGGDRVVKKLLAEACVETNVCDNKDRSVLWYAVSRGTWTTVQQLCQAGDDINRPDWDELTPLKLAIQKRDIAMVQFFLEHCENVLHMPTSQVGAHPDFDQSSLVLASEIGDGNIIRLLLKCGVNPNTRNEYGESPLHLAATHGHAIAIKILLNSTNVDKGVRDVYDCTPLHGAAAQGHLPAVKVLLSERGIDINAKDSIGATALWRATQQRHYRVAKRLLAESGIDINAVVERTLDRTTSLYHAVQHNNEKLVRLLLKQETISLNIPNHDGILNIPNYDGTTPLVLGAAKGSIDIVKLLLMQKHIHVNAAEIGKEAPLWAAAAAGHTNVVQELLAHSKIDINETYISDTALLAAARKGHAKVVDLILRDSRVQPNRGDGDGRTALWWAAYNGHMEVVRRLIQSSRVIVINVTYLHDPVSAAESEGHGEIAQLLRAARCSTTPSTNSTARRPVILP